MIETLQVLLGEFRDKLNSLSNLVKRDVQFPLATNKIKVAIGMRRSGKTTLLFQEILKLLDDEIDISQILYVNFEDDRLLPLDRKIIANLVDAFYRLYPQNHECKCYLFFDGIQNVSDWPVVIRRLHDTKNVELFVSDSSAKLLSKEIATSLRGRSIATEIWPYSFGEWMRAKSFNSDFEIHGKKARDQFTETFNHFLLEGGFPEVTRYDPSVRQQTLQEYVDIAIYRDIIERHQVKSSAIIKYMILSLLHNVGRSFSINRFYNDLKSQGFKVGKEFLYAYAEHIEDAFIAFAVPLFNPSIRKVQSNPKKVYAIDPGLVKAVTLKKEGQLSKLFENVIYLDLRRLGCHVYYYLTAERYEIDFLIQTPQGERKLIQVTLDMENKETALREKRALDTAMNELKLPGTIITLDSYLREGLSKIV